MGKQREIQPKNDHNLYVLKFISTVFVRKRRFLRKDIKAKSVLWDWDKGGFCV